MVVQRTETTRGWLYIGWAKALDQVGDVHGHLLDLSVVELLNVAEVPDVGLGEEVDRYTLAAKTAGATDTVDVVLAVRREIVVDDERDLLDVNTTGEEIGGDEDAARSGAELAENEVALALVHVGWISNNSVTEGCESYSLYGRIESSTIIKKSVVTRFIGKTRSHRRARRCARGRA